MKFFKIILSALTIAAFAGCSFNNNSDDPQVKQDKANTANLTAKFKQVTGLYSGTIVPVGGAAIPVEMTVFTNLTKAGTYTNGDTKILPQLKVLYRQLDIVRPDSVLDASWSDDDGSFSGTTPAMSSSASSNTPAYLIGESVSLQDATADGHTIRGSVYKSDGLYGTFVVTLTSKDVSVSATDSQALYNQRLEQFYAPLVGSYSGTIVPGPGSPITGNLNYTVTFQLAISRDDTKTPILVGFYLPSNVADATDKLNVDYDPRFVPAQINLINNSTVAPGAGAVTSYYLSATGTITGSEMDLTIADRRGVLGTVKAIKLKK